MSTRTKVDESFYSKSNFGKKGWLLIVFVGIMLYFCTAMTNDGMNIAVPAIAAEHGWDYANDSCIQHTGRPDQCSRILPSQHAC